MDGVLAPWRDVMGSLGKLHRPLDDEGDSCVDANGVLWFRWTPSPEPSACASQVELLALLAALCEADPPAFEEVLDAIGGDYAHFFVKYRGRCEAPYTMGVYVLIDEEQKLRTVQTALLHDTVDNQLFADAQRRIRELTAPAQSSGQIPVFAEFESSGVRMQAAIESTLCLIRLLMQANEARLKSARPNVAFRIDTVQFGVYEDDPIDEQGMVHLVELVNCGVRLPSFKIGSPFSSFTSSSMLSQTTATLQALIGPRGIGSRPEALPRLQCLHITTPMTASMLVPLTTAIAQSHTLKHVVIDHNLERSSGREQVSMERCWRWLAPALFGQDSDHGIETLEITAEVLADLDMEVLRNVLSNEGPVLRLMTPRLQFDSPVMGLVVEVPARVEIALVHDYTRVKKDVAVFSSPHEVQASHVIQEDDSREWIHFILPGWGECRVLRKLVHVHRTPQPMRREPPRIPHLRFNYITHDDANAVQDFLSIIGSHVRRLDIHEIDDPGLDVGELLVSMIERCPRLEALDLFGMTIPTIQPLVDAFNRGTCQLKHLKLRHVLVEDMGSMHSFFDALANPSSPIAASLVQLSFHIFEQTIQNPERGSILQSCARMLQANDKIQVCRAITLSSRRRDEFSVLFEQFNGQILPTRKAPLALRSKLAFLSVVLPSQMGVQRHKDKEQGGALVGIDTNVIQNIFRFAAETEVRQCALEVPVRDW